MSSKMDTLLFAKVLKVVLQCIEEGSTLLHNFKMDGDSKGTKIIMEFQCLGTHGTFQYADNSFGPGSGSGGDQGHERLGARGFGPMAQSNGGSQPRQDSAKSLGSISYRQSMMKREQAFQDDSSTSSDFSGEEPIGSALHRALGDEAYRQLQKGLKHNAGELSSNSSTSTLTSSEDAEERVLPVKTSRSDQSPRARFFLGESASAGETLTKPQQKNMPRFFQGNNLAGAAGDKKPVPVKPPELPKPKADEEKKVVLDSYSEPIEDSLNFLKRYAQKYDKSDDESSRSGVILGNGSATAVKTTCDTQSTQSAVNHSSPSHSILKPSVSLDSGIGSDNGAATDKGIMSSRSDRGVKFRDAMPQSLAAVPEEVPDSPDLDYPTRADIHGAFSSPRLSLAPDDPDWKEESGSLDDDDDDLGSGDSDDSVELISQARERRLSRQLERRKSVLTL